MRILLLIPVWKRPEILQIFLYHLRGTMPDYCEVMPLFILSPEDPDRQKIEYLIGRAPRCYADNQPLGAKMNAGLTHARQYEWNYLMNIGSDNVFTYRLWDLYESYFLDRRPFFGINDCYFYDQENERALFVSDYTTGADDMPMPIGAGRCIRRDLIQGITELYRPHFNWGMDGSSAWTLQQAGWLPEVVPTDREPVMLDIKTRTNLTQWEELKGEAVPVEFIREHFNLQSIDRDACELLTFDGFHDAVLKASNHIPKRDAFCQVNSRYESAFMEKRFSTYESYKVTVTTKFKR